MSVVSEVRDVEERVSGAVGGGGGAGDGGVVWGVGEVAVMDGRAVNGTARSIGGRAGGVRDIQSGYLYQYAFAMIIGLAALLGMIWYVSF